MVRAVVVVMVVGAVVVDLVVMVMIVADIYMINLECGVALF